QVRRETRNLDEARDLLGSDDLAGRIERMRADLRERDKRIAELQGKLAGGATRDVLADARRVDGITVLATRIDGLDDKGLRDMADRLRDRIKSGVIVLGTAGGGGAGRVRAGAEGPPGTVPARQRTK